MLLGSRSGVLLRTCLHMTAAADGMARFSYGIGGRDLLLTGNVAHRTACTGHDEAAVCRCGRRLCCHFRTGCPRLSLAWSTTGLLLGMSAVGKGVDRIDAAIIAPTADGLASGLAAGLGLRLRTGFSCGSVLACGLHNAGGHRPRHRIGQHAGERTPQRIAGDSGVQPDPRDDGVNFLGNLDHGKYHHDPRQYIQSAGVEGQDRQQHFDEHHIHHHQQAHGTVHTAPAGKNIRGAAAAAYAEGQRRHDGQHRQNEVAFRHLKEQLAGLEHNDKTADNDQQP